MKKIGTSVEASANAPLNIITTKINVAIIAVAFGHTGTMECLWQEGHENLAFGQEILV